MYSGKNILSVEWAKKNCCLHQCFMAEFHTRSQPHVQSLGLKQSLATTRNSQAEENQTLSLHQWGFSTHMHALISHPTHYFNFPNSFPVYMMSRQGVNFLRVSRSFNYVMYVSHKCIAQEIAEFQHLKLKIFQGSISLSSPKENILWFQCWGWH